MLWPSISRWKFQRMRIGKLMASAWCLTMVCRATSAMEASMMPASQARAVPWMVISSEGLISPSRSTTRPSVANRKTS